MYIYHYNVAYELVFTYSVVPRMSNLDSFRDG